VAGLSPLSLCAILALIAIAAAGCSISDLSPALPPLPPNPPEMQEVNREATAIFAVLKLPGSPQMSRLRPANASSLADWMFCLRSDADDIPRNYALFMRKGTPTSFRLAVQVDACAQEKFQPVPKPG
jgi:hypothetical protein